MKHNDKPMLCPFCKQPLVVGEQRRYETLCDHVDDPNRTDYPLRNTYECSCKKSKDTFWDIYGDYYSKHYSAGTEAINSIAYESANRIR